MIRKEELERYARMLLRVGLGLRKGQEFMINASLEAAPLVRELTRQAYEMGAKDVHINWQDAECEKLRYLCQDEETLGSFPDWKAEMYNGYCRRGCAYLAITSDDLDAFAGVDAARIALAGRAKTAATLEAVNCRMTGVAPWLVAGYPGVKWAQKVFPGLPADEAVDKLWDAILFVTRAKQDDPEAAWKAHQSNLDRRKAWLNAQHFTAMHYAAPNGTDFTVGLADKHIWDGGCVAIEGKNSFIPNMPTEEIFSVPDSRKAEGTLVAALPLSYNGNLIADFRLTFKDGKVVDYDAGTGKEALRSILETDDGAGRLGEIALIPVDSPLAQLGLLFYSTLYDENASCHFALGRAYPSCYEGGEDMTKEALIAAGVNDSLVHVDFMVGTKDLTITGIRADGAEVPVFEHGVWAKDTEA